MSFRRRRYPIIVAAGFFAACSSLSADQSLSVVQFRDRLAGGWVGQMAGVAWGAPTELVYLNRVMLDSEVPTWYSAAVNNAYDQDDLYVEMPFIQTLQTKGPAANWQAYGDAFRDTAFPLWCANDAARQNLRGVAGGSGAIAAPGSGHPSNNPNWYNSLDFQIEANFAGLVAPGQINAATSIAWRAGHVINYGDGVYGGVAIAAMQSAAYTATSVRQIVDAARNAIPVNTRYREMMDDVVQWYDQDPTKTNWQGTWQKVFDKWNQSDGVAWAPIGARLNSAYILTGLLYGNGDFEKSMKIAMQCGADSDCNPSSVGGILGAYLGFSNIPGQYTSGLNRAGKFSFTDQTFDSTLATVESIARQVTVLHGGKITGSGDSETWSFPQETTHTLIREQWVADKDLPQLTAGVSSADGLTVSFLASALSASGISGYQWYFDDLSILDGPAVSHTFATLGDHEVLAYTTDSNGNTSWQAFTVNVVPEPGALMALSVMGLLLRRRPAR